MFVLVQNRGEIPLWGIRVIGYSSKNEKQIGRFGTGLKESIALLIRNNASPIIYSGTCKIEFSVNKDSGIEEIGFILSESKWSYEKDRWYSLGIHPNLGQHDWIDLWQALREIFCNAIDEDIEFLHHEIVQDQIGVAGATRVYLPLTGDVLGAYAEVENRLLMIKPKTILYQSQQGKILEKSKYSKCQVYHKGVWVQESPNDSLFDYELSDIKLNESRSCDWYDITAECSKLISNASEDVIQKYLGVAADNPEFAHTHEGNLHLSYIKSYCKSQDKWKNAFLSKFGSDAICCLSDAYYIKMAMDLGKHPICFKSDILEFLVWCKIPNHTQLVSSEIPDNLILTGQKSGMFDIIWDIFESKDLISGKIKPECHIVQPTGSFQGCVNGGKIFINTNIVGSKEEILTCIEEILHYCSGMSDFSRAFQNVLLETIVRNLNILTILYLLD